MRAAGLQYPALRSLEPHRREPSAGIGPRINTNAGRTLLDLIGDGMAVDHDLLARLDAVEEILTDPTQCLGLLGIERDARPDAGMNEGVIAEHDHVLEPSQKIEMSLRHTLPQQLEQLGIVAPIILVLADSITQNRRLPANSQEEGQRPFLPCHRFQEHLLVITEQKTDLVRPRTQIEQALYDLRRFRAPIDQIPQEDDRGIRGGTGGVIGLHLTQQIVEQVEPPVDIAHRIDAHAGRKRSRRPRRDVTLPGERRENGAKHDITVAAHTHSPLPHATFIVHTPRMTNPIGLAAHHLACLLAACTAAAQAQQPVEQTHDLYEALRAADMRVAATGYRLSIAAAALCDKLEPGTGMQLHTLAQYAPASRDAVRAHFHMTGTVAVEGVVAGGPAEQAGIRADDTIVRLGPVAPPAELSADASTAMLESIDRQLASLPPDAPIETVVRRDGHELRVTIHPQPACRARYELRIADTFDARANGELIQVTSKYLEDVDPALFPAVVAHELAHNILHHRDRLVAADASFGLASGFGRNVGLFRQTEIEADILSVHLLARANYPPSLAARFWREAGPGLLEGQLRSRSHPAFKDRIATVEAEAAKLAAGQDGLPAFHATRKAPLTGDWQALLVRNRR